MLLDARNRLKTLLDAALLRLAWVSQLGVHGERALSFSGSVAARTGTEGSRTLVGLAAPSEHVECNIRSSSSHDTVFFFLALLAAAEPVAPGLTTGPCRGLSCGLAAEPRLEALVERDICASDTSDRKLLLLSACARPPSQSTWNNLP
mmetsp:Transcript_83421/g.221031  ORF Transcript_83421/g.221031 Transcript_83421/m.221031 type:complete len:148 (+) Transcript_83421:556-999(+)